MPWAVRLGASFFLRGWVKRWGREPVLVSRPCFLIVSWGLCALLRLQVLDFVQGEINVLGNLFEK